MASLYHQSNSPYYWIRYYDPIEPNPNRRRKSINTKIAISAADKRKIKEADKVKVQGRRVKLHLEGNRQVNRLKKELEAGIVERKIKVKNGIRLVKKLILSEGLDEYITLKTRTGDKKALKPKSVLAYKNAVRHFIVGSGRDVEIHKYTNAIDYSKFLAYMEEENLAESSRNSITKHLASLWNYFIAQKYHREQIIEIYQGEKEKAPEDIPLDELKIILKYYEDQPEKWEWIYYLLLSMNRPSTALQQERSKIDFARSFIRMLNVKETRKKSKYYVYPLFHEFEELIKRIMQRPIVDKSDRLFSHFKIGKINYTDAFWWWYTDQKKLVKAELISRTYQMKQIRKTFPSFAVNELGMSKEEAQFLMDHSDKEITENHYLSMKFDRIRERFESVRVLDHEEE